MTDYEIVFKAMHDLVAEDGAEVNDAEVNPSELDEIEELRRFSAELNDPESISLTAGT